MRIITIEEHYADQRIIDATAKYGDPSYMTALPDKVRGAYNHMRFTGEKLTDVDTVRFDLCESRRSTYRYSVTPIQYRIRYRLKKQ